MKLRRHLRFFHLIHETAHYDLVGKFLLPRRNEVIDGMVFKLPRVGMQRNNAAALEVANLRPVT